MFRIATVWNSTSIMDLQLSACFGFSFSIHNTYFDSDSTLGSPLAPPWDPLGDQVGNSKLKWIQDSSNFFDGFDLVLVPVIQIYLWRIGQEHRNIIVSSTSSAETFSQV